MILLASASFVLASFYTLILRGPVTREEAIEISWKTPLVKEGLDEAMSFGFFSTPRTEFWNATYIQALEAKYYREYLTGFPEDHGVWVIAWEISVPGISIQHYIDEFTGEILYQGVRYG